MCRLDTTVDASFLTSGESNNIGKVNWIFIIGYIYGRKENLINWLYLRMIFASVLQHDKYISRFSHESWYRLNIINTIQHTGAHDTESPYIADEIVQNLVEYSIRGAVTAYLVYITHCFVQVLISMLHDILYYDKLYSVWIIKLNYTHTVTYRY